MRGPSNKTLGLVAVVLVVVVGGVAFVKHHRSRVSHEARPLPAGGRQYASDMRNAFSFGRGVSTRDLAKFGKQVCNDLGSGNSSADEVPSTLAHWSHTSPGDAIQMITLATEDMCSGERRPETVTYVVSGGGSADVTYGPSGSSHSGSVPMSVTRPLGNPSYYAMDAQLQGYGGEVRCKLEIDGVTISSASASGGYNIASCEIGRNPTTNSWEDLNSG